MYPSKAAHLIVKQTLIKKMINLTTEQKTAIVSGVVASAIFIYFIQPILSFVAYVFVRGSNIVGSAYTDRIYQQVAHLETQDYSF